MSKKFLAAVFFWSVMGFFAIKACFGAEPKPGFVRTEVPVVEPATADFYWGGPLDAGHTVATVSRAGGFILIAVVDPKWVIVVTKDGGR